MHKKVTTLLLLMMSFIFMPALQVSAQEKKGEESITAKNYLEHVKILSDEKFMGRHAGSEFELKTAEYIKEQFKKFGLKPAPGTNDFFQEFDLPKIPDNQQSYVKLSTKGTPAVTIQFGPEMMYMSPCPSAEIKGEAVHVIYGASLGEFKPLDSVKGKIVLLSILPLNKKDGPSIAELFGERVKSVEAAGATAIICLSQDLSVSFLTAFSAGKVPCLVMSPKAADKSIPGFDSQKSGEKMMGQVGPETQPLDTQFEIKLVSSALKSRNVVGILEGGNLKDEYVVIGAHMDHLGATKTADGKLQIYHGADDNASGVAGIIELARALSGCKPRRTIVFITFGSEEIGLIGSQYYVSHPLFPLEKTQLMINLDMIGRSASNSITVSSLASASEILDEVQQINENFGGVTINALPQNVAGGDHFSFYIKKVPVIFFCDMGHLDYHKPTDTIDKINAEYGQTVTRLAYQYADNFINRDGRLTYQQIKVTAPASPSRGERKSLGFVPDMGFSGKGVRVTEPTPDGPAIKAGVKTNDIIIKIDQFETPDIYKYMDACKKIKDAEKTKLTIIRDDKEIQIEINFK